MIIQIHIIYKLIGSFELTQIKYLKTETNLAHTSLNSDHQNYHDQIKNWVFS